MQLSPNFTLAEFTLSQTASRLNIENTPSTDVVKNLILTANGMEEVRKLLNSKPILISSGYRGVALNTAVKGSKSSQHTTGEACDFTCPSFGTPADIVKAIVNSDIKYDQIILEFGSWVHISFSPKNRKQALIIDSNGTREYK
jgi:zinc D-Ala-D-Ala carboxypeptidase